MLLPHHTAQLGDNFNNWTGFFLKISLIFSLQVLVLFCWASSLCMFSLLMDRTWVSQGVRVWDHCSYAWLSRPYLTKGLNLVHIQTGGFHWSVCERVPGTQDSLIFFSFWFSAQGIASCAKALSTLANGLTLIFFGSNSLWKQSTLRGLAAFPTINHHVFYY